MSGIAIYGISAVLKTDNTSMHLSICLPACLSVCLLVSWNDWSHLALPSVVYDLLVSRLTLCLSVCQPALSLTSCT